MILPTWVYGVWSEARQQVTALFWNETVAKSGANEIISAEHWHHMNAGTGATTLELWFDACPGQISNWDGVMYHMHITDQDSPLWMYERIDEKLLQQGHSYSVCDRNFAYPQHAAKRKKSVETMEDWVQLYREANKQHPYLIHKLQQSEIMDWHSYLKQHYVRTRLDSNGIKPLLEGSHWRNYGWG